MFFSMRGGSWLSQRPEFVRVSNRFRLVPTLRDNSSGFRCVMEEAPKSMTKNIPLHGGSWYVDKILTPCKANHIVHQEYRMNSSGFRCVRED